MTACLDASGQSSGADRTGAGPARGAGTLSGLRRSVVGSRSLRSGRVVAVAPATPAFAQRPEARSSRLVGHPALEGLDDADVSHDDAQGVHEGVLREPEQPAPASPHPERRGVLEPSETGRAYARTYYEEGRLSWQKDTLAPAPETSVKSDLAAAAAPSDAALTGTSRQVNGRITDAQGRSVASSRNGPVSASLLRGAGAAWTGRPRASENQGASDAPVRYALLTVSIELPLLRAARTYADRA